MSTSFGPIRPHHAGGSPRVIQGFFPCGGPRFIHPTGALGMPRSPRPALPMPIGPASMPTGPASSKGPILPARAGAVQPAPQPSRPITSANSLQSRIPLPPPPIKPPATRPILPQAAPSPVLHASSSNAFVLPRSVVLRCSQLGQRLPAAVQQKMEAFFNANFSRVRIHVGPEAAAIGALAFTHGTDLYFAPGHYNPTTPQGQRLLGHELTHVTQQMAGRVRNPLASGIAVVQDPALEAEAEQMGQRAALANLPILQAKPAAAGLTPVPAAPTKTKPVPVSPSTRRFAIQRMQSLAPTIKNQILSALGDVKQTDLSKEEILKALKKQFGEKLHEATKDPVFAEALLELIRSKQSLEWQNATKITPVPNQSWKSPVELGKWSVRHYSNKFMVVLGAETSLGSGLFYIADVEPPPFMEILSSITIATFPPPSGPQAEPNFKPGDKVLMAYSSGAESSGHTTTIDWATIGNVGDTFYGLFYGEEPATGIVPPFIRDAVYYATWPVADAGTGWWASADWLQATKVSNLSAVNLGSRSGSLADIIADIIPTAATTESGADVKQRESKFQIMDNFEVKKHSPMHVQSWIPLTKTLAKIKTWKINPVKQTFTKLDAHAMFESLQSNVSPKPVANVGRSKPSHQPQPGPILPVSTASVPLKPSGHVAPTKSISRLQPGPLPDSTATVPLKLTGHVSPTAPRKFPQPAQFLESTASTPQQPTGRLPGKIADNPAFKRFQDT